MQVNGETAITVLELYKQGYSVKDIMDKLELTENTVRFIISKGEEE